MGLFSLFKKAQENHDIKTAERNKKIAELNARLEDEKRASQERISEYKAQLEEKKTRKHSPDSAKQQLSENKKNSTNTLTVKVVGTNYVNQEDILSLGTINSDYSLNKAALIKKFPDGATIYEYIFPEYEAVFEFEPTNEHDANAIMVLINGIKVGYVKKGSCARIRNLINNSKIISITANIYSGNSKNLDCMAGIGEKPTSSDYQLEKYSGDIRVALTLTLNDK